MTGFPGETDAEFEETRAFIESLPFTYLHVFTYSERPGTPARDGRAGADGTPPRSQPGPCANWRAEKNLEFRRQMLGRRLSVVTLERRRAHG